MHDKPPRIADMLPEDPISVTRERSACLLEYPVRT